MRKCHAPDPSIDQRQPSNSRHHPPHTLQRWKNDKANGKGCKTFACGDRHEGLYIDDKRQGHGTYQWASGDRYEGNWKNGKMHGPGTKTMVNGDTYTGEWRVDKANGHGHKRFASGDEHVGEYRHDFRHGYGEYTWVTGDRFHGVWVRGLQSGPGTYYYENGDVFKGVWLAGKKHGPGVFTAVTQRQSFQEKWDHGNREARLEIKYVPTRMLKTCKESADKLMAQAEAEAEANRLRKEIDRLQNRLATIQTSSPGVQGQLASLQSMLQPQFESSVGSATSSNTGGDAARPAGPVSPGSPPFSFIPLERSSTPPPVPSALVGSPSTSPAFSPTPPENSPRIPSASMPELQDSPNWVFSAVDQQQQRQLQQAQSSIDQHRLSSERQRSASSNELDVRACCKVCYDAPINTVFVDCGHMATCLECSNQLESCPICRTRINQVVQTYQS